MKQSRLLAGVVGALAVVALAGMAYAKDREEGHHAEKGVQKHDEQKQDVQKGVSRSVTLSNTAPTPLSDIEISFSGKDAGDFSQTNNCGEKLAGKASCTISVLFAPRSTGQKNATMEIHTSGGKQTVPLSGTGV